MNYDTIHKPFDRFGEKCLNCNYTYGYHHGWACEGETEFYGKVKDDIPLYAQYYTKDMMRDRRSLLGAKGFIIGEQSTLEALYNDLSRIADKKENIIHDTDHWKAWAHNEPGDCPCGIKRNLCDYHK